MALLGRAYTFIYFQKKILPNRLLRTTFLWTKLDMVKYAYNSINRTCSIKRPGLEYFKKKLY